MKAFTVRCPDCGAQLKAEKGASECSYCGSSIMVEGSASRDSGAVPGQSEDRPTALPSREGATGPPATLILVVSLLLLGATVLGLVLSSSGNGPGPAMPKEGAADRQRQVARPSEAPPTPVMEFEAHHPVLVPVDSDGVDDILGYFEGPDDTYFVAALHGVDGSLLWRSDAVPGIVGSEEPHVIVGSEVVFAATASGDLTAYSRRDGGTLWSVRLAEVVDQIFEVDPKTVRILLTDDQLVHVGLEKGSVMAAPEGATELQRALPDMNGQKSRSGVRIERFSGSRTFGDVDANLLAIAEDGSFQVSMGKRRKGTSTPILIRYEGVVEYGSRGKLKELWRTPVPGVEPMKARMPMAFDAYLHATSSIVCAAYHTTDKVGVAPSRLAAFDMQDGRRLWDHPLPEGAHFTSVTVDGPRIYLVAWTGLTVMEAESGDVLFVIDELPLD